MIFKILTSRILAFFFYKTCNFLTVIVIIQFFPDPGARKPPHRFDKLLKNFHSPWNSFNFLISQILAIFFIKLAISSFF